MKKSILSIALLFTILSGVTICYSQTNNFTKTELSDKILNKNAKIELNDDIGNLVKKEINMDDSKEKSPYLAALMSAVIPGSGEFYAKSYIKSAIFFGAEVGLWVVYSTFQKKGNDKTNEYQNYANANWNINKYALWLKNQGFPGSSGINPNEPDFETLRAEVNICEAQNFSHTLPPFGEQQYYEVIGKYQSFIGGWSNAGSDINRNNFETYVLPQVQNYMVNRQKANDYFSTASLSIDVIVLNHLLSAADAAWSVTMFNKNINVNTSLNIKNLYNYTHNEYKLTPFANIKVTF
jgi:hypothetical protein